MAGACMVVVLLLARLPSVHTYRSSSVLVRLPRERGRPKALGWRELGCKGRRRRRWRPPRRVYRRFYLPGLLFGPGKEVPAFFQHGGWRGGPLRRGLAVEHGKSMYLAWMHRPWPRHSRRHYIGAAWKQDCLKTPPLLAEEGDWKNITVTASGKLGSGGGRQPPCHSPWVKGGVL